MAGSVPLTTLCTAELMLSATVEQAVPAGLPDGLASEAATFFGLDKAIPDAEHAEYDACETGVAAEYVPIHGAAAYRSGRAAFLRAMLAMDCLFHTLSSHAVLDTRTRANMRRARAGLEGPPRQADRDAIVGTPAKTYDGRAVRPMAAVLNVWADWLPSRLPMPSANAVMPSSWLSVASPTLVAGAGSPSRGQPRMAEAGSGDCDGAALWWTTERC